MEQLLDHQVWGIPVVRWAIALAVMLGAFFTLLGAKRVAIERLDRLHRSAGTPWHDVLLRVVRSTRSATLVAAGLAAGARALDLTPEAELWIGRTLILVLAVQAGLWVTHAVKVVVETRQAGPDAPPGRRTVGAAASFVTNLVVWTLIVLVVLSNFGVEVSTLVAGLGISGIAAALAVQNVLGDLFASFSIYVDRPFDLGDFVVVDTFMGTVERIGWRSTQLRSLSGELIVLANSDLARARIRNFQRMKERRLVIPFGVEYATAPEKLERIPGIVRDAVAKIEMLRFDRATLARFGDSALEYEVVVHVLDAGLAAQALEQEKLLLAIHRRLGEEGIGFAFPTRTIHVHHHGGSEDERATFRAAVD